MRILSTKLPLKAEVGKEHIYTTIIKWLKDGSSKVVGEKFEQHDKKTEVHIVEGYHTFDTLSGKRNGVEYIAFRLSHIYHAQTWDTEIICEEGVGGKTVTIHINCSGDTTLFKKVPITRTEIIRAFINDGLIQNGKLPVQAKPIIANYDLLDCFAEVMTTRYDQALPMVYISKLFDSSGYIADTERLARYLSGVAYIVAEESGDLAFNLKEKTNGANPFNGHIAIYYPNGKIDRIRPNEVQVWGAADSRIMSDIVKAVTAQVDKDAASWEQLNTEKNASLLDDYINGYDTVEAKLEAAKERIAQLTEENNALHSKNESLQAAFDASGIEECIITKAPIEEFFAGEQHDLLVTVLKEASMRNGSFDTRQYELINSLLENNEYTNGGRETEEVVKRVLSSGEQINKRDIAELKRVGFELVSDSPHYKFVYRGNERYWFTVSKSPSDRRSGQNNASDIIKRLTVYQ